MIGLELPSWHLTVLTIGVVTGSHCGDQTDPCTGPSYTPLPPHTHTHLPHPPKDYCASPVRSKLASAPYPLPLGVLSMAGTPYL